MSHEIHVIPVPDSEEHEENENCRCNPKEEEKVGTIKIFIHRPSDGREYCKLKINKKWAKIDFLST